MADLLYDVGSAEEDKKRKQRVQQQSMPVATQTQAPKKAKETEPQKKIENPLAGKTPKIDLGNEILNVVADAPTNLLEGVLNRADLIKDTVGVGLNALRGAKTPGKGNPFSDEYVEASYDLGVQGPKTQVGKLASGILTFALGAKLVGKALPLKTGGLASGAISDFVLTKPEDGTLSTLIRDQDWIPPGMEDTFMLALAAKGDDNAWVSKFKAVLEGGVIGKAADAAVWGFKAIRAGQAAKAAGKSDAQALEIAGKAAQDAQKEVDIKSAQESAVENDRWDDYNADKFDDLRGQEEEMNQMVSKLGEQFGEDSPEYLEGLDMLEGLQKEINDFDWGEARRVDPTGLAPQEKASYKSSASVNEAVTSQIKLETSIPDAVKVDPNFKGDATSPTIGSSPTMITDAGFKILGQGGMSEGVQSMLRDFIRQPELRKIAKDAKRSIRQAVTDAAKIVEEVRDALEPINYQGQSILEVLDNVKSAKATVVQDGVTMLSPEGVIAAKALITDTSNQIFNLSTNLDQMAEIRVAGGNQVDRLVDRLTGLVELHKYYGSDKGFGLRAMQELPFGRIGGNAADSGAKTDMTLGKLKDWGERIKKLARDGDPAAQEEMDKMVRAMVMAGGDPTKTVKFLHLATKVGIDSLLKGMYSSMLSGPITHMRNAVGNTYALMERPLSVFLDGKIKGDVHKKAAAMAGFHAIRSGLGDALAVAAQTLKTGEPVQINRKFVLDDAYTRAALENMKMVAKTDAEQRAASFTGFLYDFHNSPFISFPSRALMASDDFFKHLNARQKVATDAMYKASLEGGSPNNVDGVFRKYMDEFSKKIDPSTGEIVDEDLLDYAQRATFQDDPGSLVGKMALAMEEVPLMKIFIPFVRTPINILRYTAEHTPGFNRFSEEYVSVMNGTDELLKAEMRGREAIGAMTVASIGMLSLSGLITGNGPINAEERKIWELNNQKLSLKVGDKWVSYQALEPLSTIMAVVADAGMLARMGATDWAEKIIGQMGYSITAAITEKSFLAGLSSLSLALDPKNITNEDRVINGLLNTTNNFLPYAGARRGLANALDPYVKEVQTELERAMNSAIPLYKNTQPTRTDVFTGEPMESLGGGVWNAMFPFRIKKINQNPVVDKLIDIGFEFNQITKTGPNGIELTPSEQARFSKYIYETKFTNNLARIMKQDWFNQSIDAYRNRTGSLDKKVTQHYMAVQQEVDSAKSAAFNRMIYAPENRDIYDRIAAVRLGKRQALTGNVDQAVQTLSTYYRQN